MVHNKHRISKQQAAAMGMLTSEAGLAAMHAVLAAQHAQRAAVLGAASQGYWRALAGRRAAAASPVSGP